MTGSMGLPRKCSRGNGRRTVFGLRPGTRYYARIRTLLSVRGFPRPTWSARMYDDLDLRDDEKNQVPRDACVSCRQSGSGCDTTQQPDAADQTGLHNKCGPAGAGPRNQHPSGRSAVALRVLPGRLVVVADLCHPGPNRIWWFAPAFGGYSDTNSASSATPDRVRTLACDASARDPVMRAPGSPETNTGETSRTHVARLKLWRPADPGFPPDLQFDRRSNRSDSSHP